MKISEQINDIPHPSEFIRDELRARGWSQRYLANRMGTNGKDVKSIMSGETGISPEIAQSLSKSFGISPEFFMNLQKMYES